MRGNSGADEIADVGGRDTLVLSAFSRSEVVKLAVPVDYLTKNGKPDTLVLPLDRKDTNGIIIPAFYDDTRSKGQTLRPGFGYIETFQFKR